jgi:hypothetical protein
MLNQKLKRVLQTLKLLKNQPLLKLMPKRKPPKLQVMFLSDLLTELID